MSPLIDSNEHLYIQEFMKKHKDVISLMEAKLLDSSVTLEDFGSAIRFLKRDYVILTGLFRDMGISLTRPSY